MSADLAAGVRRLPQSAVIATVAGAETLRPRRAVTPARLLNKPRRKTRCLPHWPNRRVKQLRARLPGASPTRGGCCTGRGKLGGKSVLGQPARLVNVGLHAPVPFDLSCAVAKGCTAFKGLPLIGGDLSSLSRWSFSAGEVSSDGDARRSRAVMLRNHPPAKRQPDVASGMARREGLLLQPVQMESPRRSA